MHAWHCHDGWPEEDHTRSAYLQVGGGLDYCEPARPVFDVTPPSVTNLDTDFCMTDADWLEMPATLQLTRLATYGDLVPEALSHLGAAVDVKCLAISAPVLQQLPALVSQLQILDVDGLPPASLACLTALPGLKDLNVRQGQEHTIELRGFPSLAHFAFEGPCMIFEAPAGSSCVHLLYERWHISWSKA